MRTGMIQRITVYGMACFMVGSGKETKSIEGSNWFRELLYAFISKWQTFSMVDKIWRPLFGLQAGSVRHSAVLQSIGILLRMTLQTWHFAHRKSIVPMHLSIECSSFGSSWPLPSSVECLVDADGWSFEPLEWWTFGPALHLQLLNWPAQALLCLF